jgi:hypothetical protein
MQRRVLSRPDTTARATADSALLHEPTKEMQVTPQVPECMNSDLKNSSAYAAHDLHKICRVIGDE